MKNSDEMVNSLLERRDRYVIEQKRKRRMITRTATSMCCVCLVILLGFGMWQGGMFDTTSLITAGDSTNIGEKDYSEPNESNTDADAQLSNNNDDLSIASSDTAIAGVNHPYGDDYGPDENVKTMISSFDVNGTPSTSYAAPENGKFSFSIPLREAMNEYGDSVLYRVVVDIFSNKEQLSSDSSQVQDECERLSNLGYIVAYETIFDGESYHYYFTLHATYDKLKKFIADENYGYFMFLYDERMS